VFLLILSGKNFKLGTFVDYNRESMPMLFGEMEKNDIKPIRALLVTLVFCMLLVSYVVNNFHSQLSIVKSHVCLSVCLHVCLCRTQRHWTTSTASKLWVQARSVVLCSYSTKLLKNTTQ